MRIDPATFDSLFHCFYSIGHHSKDGQCFTERLQENTIAIDIILSNKFEAVLLSTAFSGFSNISHSNDARCSILVTLIIFFTPSKEVERFTLRNLLFNWLPVSTRCFSSQVKKKHTLFLAEKTGLAYNLGRAS